MPLFEVNETWACYVIKQQSNDTAQGDITVDINRLDYFRNHFSELIW